MERTAKIDNWFVQAVNDENGRQFVLKGTVTEHPRNPQPGEDGLHSTSPITNIDFEKGLAFSQNTEYTLGQPVQPQPPAPAAA